jgi:hypothetical protein
MSFDYLWWVMIAFFTVRLLKTDDPRYWLGIGAGIGLAATRINRLFFKLVSLFFPSIPQINALS